MKFDQSLLKELYVPDSNSHKGQNGKVLVIAGSKLFHAASLWPLEIASKIVDMVFYASIEENNTLVTHIKEEFRNGIVIPRNKIDDYIEETDVILIGPGLPRNSGEEEGDDDTRELTERLLTKYAHKKWVVDGGSLQVIAPSILPTGSIITPHEKEFTTLFGKEKDLNSESIGEIAKQYEITILLKGETDIVCSKDRFLEIEGGNAGMTKGGTGDVLAGLVASLFSKNEAFISAACASYINKKAGERLFEKVGYYFNATDLVHEIPLVMKELLLHK